MKMNRKKDIITKTSDYQSNLLDSLTDKEEVMAYLQVALREYEEDGDTKSFLLALKNVADAQGSVGQLAKKSSFGGSQATRRP